MINHSRVSNFGAQLMTYLPLWHGVESKERDDCFSHILPYSGPQLLVESNGEAIWTEGFQVLHVELGGLDFLRVWGSEKVCIFIFCTQGRIKYSRWVRKWTSSLNCCLKFSRKNYLMSLDLEIHEPSFVLIVSILFLLLRKMVERWKNFEFLALARFP